MKDQWAAAAAAVAAPAVRRCAQKRANYKTPEANQGKNVKNFGLYKYRYKRRFFRVHVCNVHTVGWNASTANLHTL